MNVFIGDTKAKKMTYMLHVHPFKFHGIILFKKMYFRAKMDPVVSLRRASSVDVSLCFRYQREGGVLWNRSTQGIDTLSKAAESGKIYEILRTVVALIV